MGGCASSDFICLKVSFSPEDENVERTAIFVSLLTSMKLTGIYRQ